MHNIFYGLLLSVVVSNAAYADCQGDFTPMVDGSTNGVFTRVHQFPKDGNQFMIAGAMQTIPSAVGVISGGVIGVYNDASIDKVPHQTLAPFTRYFVYDYMVPGNPDPVMDFSTTGHEEDPTFGNEVNARDPSRSLVGMVYTNAEGKFVGDGTRQLTLSWCHPIRSGVRSLIAGASTSSASLAVPLASGQPPAEIEWLTWGVNASFPESMDLPDISADGTTTSDTVGACSWIGIEVDGSPPSPLNVAQPITGDFYAAANAGHPLHAWASNQGAPEGHHTAQIMVTNVGSVPGCAPGAKISITSGTLHTTPVRS